VEIVKICLVVVADYYTDRMSGSGRQSTPSATNITLQSAMLVWWVTDVWGNTKQCHLCLISFWGPGDEAACLLQQLNSPCDVYLP